ncbi:MAG TPA: N-6 DNA methylase [Blastocatellia bacterium]
MKRDERHRYGQHYTPGDVARLLAAFAVRAAADLVFDPACGDGRLLAEAINVKRQLAVQAPPECLARAVFGIDRSAQAAALAAATGAQVGQADFFNVEPGEQLTDRLRLPQNFDAVIGNPPYIRQEVMGAPDKRRIARRLASDRQLASEVNWPRWSGRSDIYVYFFARAIRFLKAGGRLVFLTASSWLDAGYGAALRQFLLNNFRVIAVIESTAESFFADASVNTSIAVLEREPDAERRAANLIRFVQLNATLAAILNQPEHGTAATLAFARFIEDAALPTTTAAHRLRMVSQSALAASDVRSSRSLGATGWGKYLRADDVFFRILERGGARLLRLSELAQVRFGVKTGANEFFYLQNAGGGAARQNMAWDALSRAAAKGKRQKANGALLALDDIARVRRGLTTGANEFFYLKPVRDHAATPPAQKVAKTTDHSFIEVHGAAGASQQIEARFLAPVVFSLKEIPAIWLTRVNSRRLFFNCALAREELRGTRALAYIRSGERAGYHLRPTCAARDRWYAVTRSRRPAPLILPSKVGERWLVAVNRAGVFEDKKLYGVYPRRGVSLRLLAALLNSTWARYYAEVTCRQMTGAQAIADIDVAVAAQLLIPDPRAISPSLRRRLEAALVEIAHRPIGSVFDEVQRADRRRLDELVLVALGFKEPTERRAALDELYAAVTRLVRARIEKAVATGHWPLLLCHTG